MKLWYRGEAREWTQALPIGNGHMGAMAYGGAAGRFDLSENTCWSGAPQERVLHENAGEYMRQARKLLTERKIQEAEQWLAKCCGLKGNYGTQLPLGRLFVSIVEPPDSAVRELDLENGMCTDELTYPNGVVRRVSFISNPQRVMVVGVTSDFETLPQIGVALEGWSQPCVTESDNKDLKVRGRALEMIHSDGLHGVSYSMRLRIDTDGSVEWSRQGMLIDNASYVYVVLAASTDMFGQDCEKECESVIDRISRLTWERLFDEHCKEHAQWMSRCSLQLARNSASDLPTDKRIRQFAEDQTDQDLIALYFQYGRYLLVNSSRPDSLLPAALQGGWNDDRACRMGWTDDMHLDINTQMNYYPAEVTGLAECVAPLFTWIKHILKPNGVKIARELYNSEGWVAHTVSNAYGWAAPGWEGVDWAFHVTGGAWIASHIWIHYLYTKDEVFLREYYDVLYDAGVFLHALLTEDPKTGELVTNPSYSPENAYMHEGQFARITTGATIDTIISRYIFQAVIEGAAVLGVEDHFTRELEGTLTRLPGFKIGRYGQLQEWNEDYEEALPDHRHTSHLLSMHPFNQINPSESPELKTAIKTTINRRLGNGGDDMVLANWAGALLILYHARLLDGEAAGRFVTPMISFLSRDNMMITHEGPTTSITGGIYELDGNTGLTAGIAEMLLQSYNGYVHILPALPQSWKEGKVCGLIAEGGHKVDIAWNGNEIRVCILPAIDGRMGVKYKERFVYLNVKKNEVKEWLAWSMKG